MNLPGGSTGRLLALALLLVPLALAYRLAVLPLWQSYQAENQRVSDARQELQRYRRMAAQLDALKAHDAKLSDSSQLAPYLLDAPNAALAAAYVQQRLKDLAGTHDGRILSTRVVKSNDDAATCEQIAVNARLQLSLEGLQALLHELETGQPYLFFKDLSVMSRPARRSRRRAAKNGNGLLETRLTVFGLRRSAAPEANSG